ncbi:hypothetical protein DYB38_012643, partial [Aphanomyces astaci]
VDMREYLSPTCLVVKMAGLVTAYAAVTSSFYMVRNLPRSFFAALAGAVTIAFLVTDGQYGLFDRSAGLGITDTNFTKCVSAISENAIHLL